MFVESAIGDESRTQWILSAAIGPAAARGNRHIVDYLLGVGADMNSRLEGAFEMLGSALILAVVGGHESVVGLLLAHGANVNLRLEGKYGRALGAAVALGRNSIVKFLLESGADVNTAPEVLIVAARNSNEVLVELLMSHGEDVNIKAINEEDEMETAALLEAVAAKNVSMARLLLTYNADANTKYIRRDGVECTALGYAVSMDDVLMVDLLLSHGADVNLKLGDSRPAALMAAIENNNEAMVKLLLDCGASIDGKSMAGRIKREVKKSIGTLLRTMHRDVVAIARPSALHTIRDTRHFLFVKAPAVTGGGPVYQNVYIASPPLRFPTGSYSFTCISDPFAITGTNPDQPLAPMAQFAASDWAAAMVNQNGSPGSHFLMKTDGPGNAILDSSAVKQDCDPPGVFPIECSAFQAGSGGEFIGPSFGFIGLGAQDPEDAGNIIPIATVEAQPNTTTHFSPIVQYYISWGQPGSHVPGQIVELTTVPTPAVVDFTGRPATAAEVVHQQDGE
ncbi:hypothetical protein ACJZ2D_000423 [Fusarium nematophilum]